MRAREIMPGQSYATPDGIVVVTEVDVRGGAVRPADGRTWRCRDIHTTTPKAPGSRVVSRPLAVTCETCSADPAAGCHTAAGNPCPPHEPRFQSGIVGLDPARTVHPHRPTRWSADRLIGATHK